MKNEKIIIILILLVSFSCQNNRKTKPDSTPKIEKISSNSESSTETIIEEKNNINPVFRNITDLEKYKGFKKVSAQVVGDSNKALVYIEKDSLKVLVLEKIIKTSSPRPNYMVLDEVSLVFENSNSKQYIALVQCELIENSLEKNIFSLVENEEVEFFNNILKSWIIDLKVTIHPLKSSHF